MWHCYIVVFIRFSGRKCNEISSQALVFFFSHHKLSFFDSLGTYSLLWMLMVTRLPSCYFYSQAGFSGQPENVLVTDAQWANECKAVSQESCHGKRPQLSLTCRVVWGFLFYLFIYFYRQDHVITPSPPWSSDHIARYQLCNNLKYFSGNTPPPSWNVHMGFVTLLSQEMELCVQWWSVR